MQEPVDGNTMDSQETNDGLVPKTKKTKKCTGWQNPVASLKSWLRIPLNAGKMREYAKWLYLSANGAVLSAKRLGVRD